MRKVCKVLNETLTTPLLAALALPTAACRKLLVDINLRRKGCYWRRRYRKNRDDSDSCEKKRKGNSPTQKKNQNCEAFIVLWVNK